MNHNNWVREKESWVITTTKEEKGGFNPVDPPSGMWEPHDLYSLLGTYEIVPLQGKWDGEVIVHNPSSDGFVNRLANRLVLESLGQEVKLRGSVLMTKGGLVRT